MIQKLTDHQERLTQELNVQLANTMTENFTQAMNILQVDDTNSEQVTLPKTHHVSNVINDSNVTNL